jgi:hypothetical protein
VVAGDILQDIGRNALRDETMLARHSAGLLILIVYIIEH